MVEGNKLLSFLKTHWRFTVLAVMVLCVLLRGVVALNNTSEPPEPKAVYALPTCSSDNLPVTLFFTGGIYNANLGNTRCYMCRLSVWSVPCVREI